MGIFKDFRDDVGNLRIAMPDEAMGQILYKWHENAIRKYSKVIVEPGYVALLVTQGQVIGQLEPGQHDIDSAQLPVIGAILDRIFYDNAYRCELIFCRTAETRGLTFGGPLDLVKDPDYGIPVAIRVYGDYAIQVVDSGLLIQTVTSMGTVSNEALTDFVGRQLLNRMGEAVVTGVVNREIPILGIRSKTTAIQDATLQRVNPELAQNGLCIVRFGDFNVNVEEDDVERLEQLYDKNANIGLAGNENYERYARGKMMEGAGEGMAKGGGSVDGAFIGMGMNMGGMMGGQMNQGFPPPGGQQGYQHPQQSGPAPAQQSDQVPCPSCGALNSSSAKFCSECGASMKPQPRKCAKCGAELSATAKFCGECGTPVES